jgi:hypothetical protein
MKLLHGGTNLTDMQVFSGDGEMRLMEILSSEAKELTKMLIARVDAELPGVWKSYGGRDWCEQNDPLTVYLRLDDEEEILAIFSLTRIIECTIELVSEDAGYDPGLKAVSEKMKELSARIDALCERSGGADV